MIADSAWTLVALPLGLGLLGFIEPCSIGASLLFIKAVEGHATRTKLMQVAVFTLTRAIFIGLLGAAAAVVGTVFVELQRAGWLLLGSLYLALGIVYLIGRAGALERAFGPSLSRLATVRRAAALAILFGLNIPACAAPLLAAVLGAAAVAGPAKIAEGFVMLALFGLALSLPLAVALLWPLARRALDRAAGLSRRVPTAVGLLFVLLGAWSIWFGLFATVGVQS